MAEYISFQPSDFFSTKLYTGTGASNAITGVGFQPDFVWAKVRSTTYDHYLFDSVRGVQKDIRSNENYAEGSSVNYLTAFGADGFTMGSDSGVNINLGTFASWNWKAGTTTGIAGSPSITPSSYSFNATSGFSIIKYVGIDTAGATIPHGLGVAPKMVIIKDLDNANAWAVYHEAMGNTKVMYLNTTTAEIPMTVAWNDTSPTSTLFSLGTSSIVNYNPRNYVAYCFADIKGYSKFGGYTGNGNADGAFVYTGFRPAFILIKHTTPYAENWNIYDDKRLGYNAENDALNPNTAGTGYTTEDLDIVSNGFKLRTTNSRVNDGEYMYAAFAEFPIVSSNDVPTVAR